MTVMCTDVSLMFNAGTQAVFGFDVVPRDLQLLEKNQLNHDELRLRTIHRFQPLCFGGHRKV